MADVISRLGALAEIRNLYPSPPISGCDDILRSWERKYHPYIECENAINNLPSAQKKGFWRNYEGTLQCSVCNAEFNKEIMEYCGDDVPRFCPDCGADTKGEWVWQRR